MFSYQYIYKTVTALSLPIIDFITIVPNRNNAALKSENKAFILQRQTKLVFSPSIYTAINDILLRETIMMHYFIF